MVAVLPALADALCLAGLAQQAIGASLIKTSPPTPSSGNHPAITLLKPLYGTEPLLEAALESCFLLDYPKFQLVFGAADPTDPVLAIIAALRRRYPQVDVAVITGPTPPGRNRKIANLIAMLPAAKHDLLVISDADIHARPDYLTAIAAATNATNTGLITSFYTGLPASPALPAVLGAMQINHQFLPGAAIARALGRRDCLGATMALSRATLTAIGGLPALLDHLADDNVLGQRVRAIGQPINLARTIPATSVTESTFRALIRHELRWARTIRALVPGAYWGLIVQFPLFWALAGLVLADFATWAWIVLALAAGLRYALARHLERRLGLAGGGAKSPTLAKTAAPWLFLLRDGLSAIIFVASFWSDTVDWRGQTLHADSGRSNGAFSPAASPVHELGSKR
ncbi:MAG: glycosyl transferase [Acidiphilium sp. 37-64-53]|uniref:bacteriohopanetetrol glucosamine biosynthesis glycosyltransferase HpnI n=1 Tax=Acidiphilium TaxID=522 RepID=UPI000BD1D393|nr:MULTISPECIES: bacteriohopanetetrol glucosamine biosynthesis glycosyltransferase HpnI [Acidiphilium]OYW01726.1 MAG: glycosyl transferase [Acidiphilium sp. 37-64-53]OZB28970.1 MAG: glycosyl transferase [Acidiphilium sp. 34-64-41]HQT85812.1 bacteriohopanetetrol glucosamine biosynthesis glycosyltransferase HpnI [Acidiphilium rubrum]